MWRTLFAKSEWDEHCKPIMRAFARKAQDWVKHIKKLLPDEAAMKTTLVEMSGFEEWPHFTAHQMQVLFDKEFHKFDWDAGKLLRAMKMAWQFESPTACDYGTFTYDRHPVHVVGPQRDVSLLTENDYWTFILKPSATGLVAGLTAFTMWKDCSEANCKAWQVRRQAEVLRLEKPLAMKRKRSQSPPGTKKRRDDTQAEGLWLPLYKMSELQVEDTNATSWRARASASHSIGASPLRFPTSSIASSPWKSS